jgi:hypothetical protein
VRRIAVAACCLPLVLAAAVSAASPDSSPPQPSVRCGPPNHAATPFTFTTTDHVRLEGAIVGGGRRGVVLVHEAGRKALCGWWPYAVRLAGRGFRVLLFDMRCYGLSACPQRAREAVANDIHAATRELRRRGCTSVELVGASLGFPRSSSQRLRMRESRRSST